MTLFFNATITLFFWSSAFVGVRYVVGYYDAFDFVFLRLIFATLTLGTLLKVLGQHFVSAKESLTFAIPGFISATCYFTFINLGQTTLGATESSVLINTIPVFTALLATFFYREKLAFHVWLGLFISLSGVTLLALSKEKGVFELNHGALWIITAAICAALGTILQKKLLGTHHPAVSIFYTNLYGLIFSIPFGWKGAVHFFDMDTRTNLVLIYMGVFPAGIACYFWLKILKQTSPSKAVTLLYLTPIMTSVMAYHMLDEKLTTSALIGAAITMFGVILSQSKHPLRVHRFLKAKFVTLVTK